MFNVYGDGVFLERVADNSPATLAEFSALGYDKVEARPVAGFDGTEEEAERIAEGWTPPAPPAPVEWPAGFDNPDEWEKRVMAEAEARDALEKSFSEEESEENTENEGNAE